MLEEVKKNVHKLIELYESEKQRADSLEKQLLVSRSEVEDCHKQITKLNRQIDNLQLTGLFAKEGNGAVAKERIDRLIREIDRCISLMEK